MTCPPSKSYTHRAIFAASLADGKSVIQNALYSRDTQATIEACKRFGAEIISKDGVLSIVGTPQPHPASIDAQNSGTTIRIATAIAALCSEESTLTGDSSLRARPMGPLLTSLESLGASCDSDDKKPPVKVRGPIKGGSANVSGEVSSQFATALLLAAPCTIEGMELSISGKTVSRPYIDATISVMKHFGSKVTEKTKHSEYNVTPQHYTPSSFTVPSDYSTLALLLSASVLTGDSLHINADGAGLPQGDSAFIGMLESMGVKVEYNGKTIMTRSPELLGGGTFDLGDSPDLLPPLAILVLKCDKPLHITNIEHARSKETDRLAVIAEQLGHIGIVVDSRPDSITLERPKNQNFYPATLDASGDHRIFMALCIVCMRIGGSVEGAESVDVSYPEFVNEMRTMGAQISKV